MRVFMKKAACLLSSAVLLCGATAISASAAPTTYNPNATSRSSSTTTAYNPSASSRPSTTTETGRSSGRVGRYKFFLDCGSFDIANGESKTVTVKKSSGYTVPNNSTISYQWYRDDKEIIGATDVSYIIKTKGTYYCKVKVTTAYTIRQRGVRERTVCSTDEFDTDIITASPALKIIAQPTDICYINEKTGTATVSVYAYGGHGSYTYEWTYYGSKISETSNVFGATKTGFYVCTVTDANGNTVTSKPIEVEYPDVKIEDYTKSILFNSAYGKNQTKKITVKASGGSGKYTYYLEKKDSKGGWYQVAYSYEPEFELKYEDINDNYEYTWHQPYYRDGKWHYRGTSSNTNYYRVHIRSTGEWGVAAGCADTGEITVIRENGEEDSFTSDFYYD